MSKEEKEERLLNIENLYDEYLQKTENRGISYGEIAYIEGLTEKELNDFEKELGKLI